MAMFGFPPSATAEARFPEHPPAEIIRVAERILDDLGWYIKYVEEDQIAVRTGTGFWFFGEEMTVDVSPRGTVTVYSRCIWPTQVIDPFNRNGQNVERFLDRLERRLDERARRRAEDAR
jgi:hypothetical protein